MGSIAGGTGAGMMVQPAVLHQAYHKTKDSKGSLYWSGDCSLIRALLKKKQDNNRTKIMSTYANAYACLKEINGFYLKASGKYHDMPIDVDYYREGILPYDFLFLIGRQNCEGGILGSGKAENYFEMAKEILRTQLTPIGIGAYSSEDNLILSLIERKRYESILQRRSGRYHIPF